MVVHGEDEELVQFNYERFRAEGRMDGTNLHLVHTKLSEQLAFAADDRAGARRRAPACTSSTPPPARASRRSRRRGRQGGRSTPRRSTSTRASTPSTTRRRAGSALTRTRRSSCPRTSEALWHGLVHGGALDAGHRRVSDQPRAEAAGPDHRGRDRRQPRRRGAHGHRASPRAWSSAGCRSSASPTSPRPTPRGSSGSIREKGVIAPGSDADLVPDRSRDPQDAHARRLPRERLQPVGGLGGLGLAGHDAAARAR